jgi:addiction module HigA family antidote
MGMSGAAFAAAIHVPANRITDILRQKRGITADTALRLARCFGTTADYWMNLQKAYELRLAEQTVRKEISKTVKPRAA